MSQAYLLLDRVQIEGLPKRLFELGSMTFQSLYQKTAYGLMEEVGPVLVPVSPNSPLAHAFFSGVEFNVRHLAGVRGARSGCAWAFT
jgi:hypothetical protein